MHSVEVPGKLGVLRGMIHRAADGSTDRVALILHGFFSATRIGPSRLYVLLAHHLAQLGVEVWRFDCFGVGESDGSFDESSFELQLQDHEAVLTEALSISRNEVWLIGHSMGGNLAIHLASRQPSVDSLVLLAPTVGRISRKELLFGSEELQELQMHGRTIRKGILVRSEFIDAMEDESVFELASSLAVRAVVVHGSADEYWSPSGARQLARALGCCVTEIPGADHNFLQLESRRSLFEQCSNKAEEWRRYRK